MLCVAPSAEQSKLLQENCKASADLAMLRSLLVSRRCAESSCDKNALSQRGTLTITSRLVSTRAYACMHVGFLQLRYWFNRTNQTFFRDRHSEKKK